MHSPVYFIILYMLNYTKTLLPHIKVIIAENLQNYSTFFVSLLLIFLLTSNDCKAMYV